MPADAFFMPRERRGDLRYCLDHPAIGAGPSKGAVLYVHPFAEEMNKSRRMAALQARAFARAGYRVLQIDLLGCGDSSGDFGDATWPAWLGDLHAAVAWLREREQGPVWLWGLRAGCLLCVQAAHQLAEPPDLLLWQPVVGGQQALQQFLRLRAAAEAMTGDAKGAMESLRASLAAGSTVEVAGYRLGPALARALAEARLDAPLPPPATRTVWLEVATGAAAPLPPASQAVIDVWRAAARSVDAEVVAGPAFWRSVEIEEAPDLVRASVAALERARAA